MLRKRPIIVDAYAPASSSITFASQVYGWLTAGLGLTALAAFLMSRSVWFYQFVPYTGVLLLTAFLLAMSVNWGVQRFSLTTLKTLFFSYSIAEGMALGLILPLYMREYGGGMVWSAFATTGLLFGAATVYGYMTRTDLTYIRALLQFGLMGFCLITLLALIFPFFFPGFFVSIPMLYLGIVLFVGMMVTDAQLIKDTSLLLDGDNLQAQKLSLVVALTAHSRLIALFLQLLRLFAVTRDNRRS